VRQSKRMFAEDDINFCAGRTEIPDDDGADGKL
jgi:hypothetical protein